MSRETLAKAIADTAVLRGAFTLRSGRTSSYYIDKYLFTTQPRLLRPIGALLAEAIRALEQRHSVRLDRLAGAELGGVPLVTVAGLETGLPFVFIRNAKKDYGSQKQLEGALEPGDQVVLLEDVATSGGQAIEAAGVLREAGAEVVGVIAVIDRLEGARQAIEAADMAFDALLTTRDLGIDD